MFSNLKIDVVAVFPSGKTQGEQQKSAGVQQARRKVSACYRINRPRLKIDWILHVLQFQKNSAIPDGLPELALQIAWPKPVILSV
jgi:hypothetical protein